jgi:charged multivesicular body protein 2A
MGNKPPPPPQPPKTVKELVKEFSRNINKLKREFGREIMRMEMSGKKMKADLEKSIKAKEPRST